MTQRHPTRHDKQSYHAHYGVVNWLVKIGVTEKEDQNDLIERFLEDNNFVMKATTKEPIQVKASFISNRFKEFTKFVFQNSKME